MLPPVVQPPPPAFRRLAALTLLLAPLAAAAAGVPLRLDPARSKVDIAVKATIGSFTAHLQHFDARIAMDPGDRRVMTATFRCPFAAIDTGNSQRNRDMNDWQDTPRHPEVTFELISLTPAAGDAFTADGRLRFHGVQRHIRFPVTIVPAAGAVTIDGTARLDTRDFGLPIIKKFWMLKVDPVVRVTFHLEGELPARRPQAG